MPLLDHFHPPLSQERHWESFHAAWIGSLADALNRTLPPGYFAEEQVHAGPGVEIDVATLEGRAAVVGGSPNGGGTATLTAPAWAPPAPAWTVPAVFADDFEVRVFSSRTGPTLVAAIELVSPGNKDRAEARRAFATKCASYLHEGISLIVIDVVTGRRANLHNEVAELLATGGEVALPGETALYAVAYRPVRREGREEIDGWPATLVVGEQLPVLPLALSGDVSLPVDLEATYTDACRRRRLAHSPGGE
ncbi:MAG TPA: DUF4058 family protein [Gemmataceae bacterium]|nr:DUF4058 family protein [Gemmataceae bacterium]